MTRDVGVVSAAFIAAVVVVVAIFMATSDTGAWEDCAAQCAPHAPAQVRPACYCDTHTTLPTTPNEG